MNLAKAWKNRAKQYRRYFLNSEQRELRWIELFIGTSKSRDLFQESAQYADKRAAEIEAQLVATKRRLKEVEKSLKACRNVIVTADKHLGPYSDYAPFVAQVDELLSEVV